MKARLLYAAAAVLLTAAFAHPRRDDAPRKWAVVVGVGDYLNYADEAGGDLPGAVNDARGMREVLVARWGFPAENVHMLLDGAATRDAIRRELTEWVPANAKPGDLVVFYFSGHGSQTFDRDGDEDDGLDETICPADAMRSNATKDIRDDELGGWLRALPTPNVTVILDSCHSGTATRGAAPYVRAKALNRAEATDLAPAARPAAASTRGSADSFGAGVLEISAAAPDQFAMETIFESDRGLPRPGGAFTTPLVRYLWQVPPGTTYEQVFHLVRDAVRRSNFAQDPQLSRVATRGTPLFTLPGETPAATPTRPAAAAPVRATVVSAGPEGVELDAARAAGIPQGTLFRAGGAVLSVTGGDGARVRARLASGSAPAAGTPAALVAWAHPAPLLRVSVSALAAGDAAAVQRAMAPLAHVVLQTDVTAPAQLLLRRDPDAWVLSGADGSVRRRFSGSAEEAAAQLAPALRQEQAALALASLENPGQAIPLAFGFAGDRNAFRIGDALEFRVRAGGDGYLTIVDVDPAGKVTVVYPNRFEPEGRVRAGEEVVIPSPGAGFAFQVEEPTGRGVVRAFLTERPLALAFEQGDAARAEDVWEAVRRAAGAPAGRAAPVPVAGWATASVVYDFTP